MKCDKLSFRVSFHFPPIFVTPQSHLKDQRIQEKAQVSFMSFTVSHMRMAKTSIFFSAFAISTNFSLLDKDPFSLKSFL